MKPAKANCHRRQCQLERQRLKRNAKRRSTAPTRGHRRELIYQVYQTIQHFFPELFEQMRQLDDCRQKSDYCLAEIITACVAMFVFQIGSRNGLNNHRQKRHFRKNYQRVFKQRLPHMDTVHRVMKRLDDTQLEQLKHAMIQSLLTKKVLHRFRALNRYFIVAVDASGVMSFSKPHCAHCLHKTSKNGKTTYFHHVLEAKLITPNGLAISLASVWIENPDGEYEKQDCELKAFGRLADKLSALYPRLPICITADGLYPNQHFFTLCREHDWRYIVTFKDGNLPSVWQEVRELQPLCLEQHHHERLQQGTQHIERHYRWVRQIDYHGHTLHWLECLETCQGSDNTTTGRFVHLTDCEPTLTTVAALSATGRLRWKIENEGFNCQKNHGYALKHQYARRSLQAAKNYYQCLQIAHLINQLVITSSEFQQRLTGKLTIKHLWDELRGFLRFCSVCEQTLNALDRQRIQIRFA